MTYLEDNPPKVRQYRSPRRAKPSGLIVVHTAESLMDTVGPDTGAENVAAFIAGRSDPGSYHLLVDSDSTVHLVPFTAEAYGDGTGSNPYAIHLSFALAAANWPNMTAERRRAFIERGAAAAVDAAVWLHQVHGVDVPARVVSRDASERRVPGFISHGARDPGRRSDPGAGFPWADFLTAYAAEKKARTRPVEPTAKAVTKAIKTAKRDGVRPRIITRLKTIRRDLRK